MAVDGSGHFQQAWAKRVDFVANPLYAEALALQEAVSMAQTLPFKPLIVGDALALIQMLRGDLVCPQEIAGLICQIRLDMHRAQLDWPCWVPRVNNFSAHSIAQFAKMSDSIFTSWHLPPPFLVSNDSGRYPGP